jgi:hypothetical protein
MTVDDKMICDVSDRIGALLTRHSTALAKVVNAEGKVKISCAIEIADKGGQAAVKVSITSKLNELKDKSEGLVAQQKLPGVK